jgi:hypothetical protein
MSKILNFISKNFGKLSLILSLSLTGKEGILLVIILIIALYLSTNSKYIKKYINKLNKLNKLSFNNTYNTDNIDLEQKENNVDNILNTTLNLDSEKNNKNSDNIKKNIKEMINRMNTTNRNNSKKDPYENNVDELQGNYDGKSNDHNFSLYVNNATCSTPIFNLRTYNDLDFHFNFLIHDFDPKKINSLIMTKDIQKWMSSASLTNEDLSDNLLPIYFIKKINGVSDVFEYLKIFINTDADGIKIAFVQRGADYFAVKDDIDELIEKDIIKDLLNNSNYYSYNLSVHEGVLDFLERFLSLVLIAEQYIGEKVLLDIENSHENKKAYEYNYNIINSESNMFNTSI